MAAMTYFDFDLLLVAVASSRMTLQAFRHYKGSYGDLSQLIEFASRVNKRFKTAEVFIFEFLRGISIVKPHVAPALRCHLPKLDCGPEIARQIAEFVGVPLGEELRHLRSASANLAFWGY